MGRLSLQAPLRSHLPKTWARWRQRSRVAACSNLIFTFDLVKRLYLEYMSLFKFMRSGRVLSVIGIIYALSWGGSVCSFLTITGYVNVGVAAARSHIEGTHMHPSTESDMEYCVKMLIGHFSCTLTRQHTDSCFGILKSKAKKRQLGGWAPGISISEWNKVENMNKRNGDGAKLLTLDQDNGLFMCEHFTNCLTF